MAALTRRDLVLRLLRRNTNQWVDGTTIASAEVGGSEGLKRLRELRQEGFDIRMRKHPDPNRDIYQYRLVVTQTVSPVREPQADPPPPAATPGMVGREFPLSRDENGNIEIVWQVCADCGGRFAVESDHLAGEEHQRWLASKESMGVGISQPEVYAYTEDPKGIRFGEAAICPRCRGIKRPEKTLKAGIRPADTMCMDPQNHDIVCVRCNGFGIVPNIGPVPMTDTNA